MNRYGPLWQHRELDRILAQLSPSFDILNSLPLPYLKQMESLSARFSLPQDFLSISDEIMRTMDAFHLNSSFPVLAQNNHNLFSAYDSIQKQLYSLSATTSVLDSSLEMVSKTIAESLVGSEAILRITSDFQNFAVLTHVHEAFEQYATSQVTLALNASEIFRLNTFQALAISANLLLDMSQVFEFSVLMDPVLAQSQVELPPINIFQELDFEISEADLNDPNLDVENIVENSPSTRVVKLGSSLVKLIYDFNIEAERSGYEPVFKPTSKTMLAFYVISTTVATQEDLFFKVVDSLYFLIYEGSGSAKRLTSRVQESRLEALWLLKRLRLGARHDTAHGSKSEAKKKSMQVGDAYNKLIGKPLPRTREEWHEAQSTLYQLLFDMLHDIWIDSE